MAQMPTQNHCEMCMTACGNEYCLDCTQYFCSKCKIGHLRIAVCKNHRFKSSGLATSDPTVFCQDHNEAYVFICDECQLPVCKQCAVKTHRGHLMADITETVAARKSEFMSSVKSVIPAEGQKTFDDIAKEIDDQISNVNENEAETVRSIREDGRSIKQVIDEMVEELEKKVKAETENRKRELENVRLENEKAQNIMQDILNKEEKIKTSRETIGLLDEMKQLSGSFGQLKIPCVRQPSTLSYRPTQKRKDALRALMGVLVTSSSDPIIVQEENIRSGEVFEKMWSHSVSFRNGLQHLARDLDACFLFVEQEALITFYRIQNMNELNRKFTPKSVFIYLDLGLNKAWNGVVGNVAVALVQAVPGLNFVLVSDESEANIIVRENTNEPEKTRIHWEKAGENFRAVITLCDPNKERSSILPLILLFEILCALGFHKKAIQLYSILASVSESNGDHGTIKRYDPYSVLLFGFNNLIDESAWELEIKDRKSGMLSELDKVILNLMFPPSFTRDYNPQLSNTSSLLYCGRRVMDDHNQPGRSYTDGRCGPTNGPNCPACRTLIEPTRNKIAKIIQDGRFQGRSGQVYCGKPLSKRLMCGPSYGEPCKRCWNLVLDN